MPGGALGRWKNDFICDPGIALPERGDRILEVILAEPARRYSGLVETFRELASSDILGQRVVRKVFSTVPSRLIGWDLAYRFAS